MSYLSYHTRGNTSPQGKPKVYLLIDPPNEALAKAIADELLAAVNCAVFFRKERIANESEHLATLSEMNLFVLPITTNFLTGNGEAYTVEFTFAQNAQVPILPLMQESGLDELFNQKCGDLQYLDKNRREPAALPYQEKLEKFLNAILVKDELAAKIRNSFDAYVFLSYRKKDRLHIKELMQLIHENDFCRDVAIWYDEYLTPGENFNETIAEALHKSEIVALAVTPNLVNEKNYVMTVEYPMAKNAHKTILPIELVKTDKTLLENAYHGIREPITATEKDRLTAALTDAFRSVSLRQNDADPRHAYLIGLAYLSGIDVEKDPSLALTLLVSAAERKLPEAIEKLVTVYENGEGVTRSTEKAIEWQKKLIEIKQSDFIQTPTNANIQAYLDALLTLGGFYLSLCDYTNAQNTYENALTIAENNGNLLSEEKQLSLSARCHDCLGQIENACEKGNLAMRHYEKAIAIRKKLVEKTDAIDDKFDLCNSHILYGDFHITADSLYDAYREYQEALSLANELYETTATPKAAHLLAGVHIHIGDLMLNENVGVGFTHIFAKAFLEQDDETANLLYTAQNYKKADDLFEELQRYTNDPEAALALASVKSATAEIFLRLKQLDHAAAYIEKAREILLRLIERYDTYETRRALFLLYKRLGNLAKERNDFDSAAQYYGKALTFAEWLKVHFQAIDTQYLLALCYDEFGDLAFLKKEFSQALPHYEKALTIREDLAKKTGSLKARKALKISYQKFHELAQAFGDYYLALQWLFLDTKVLLNGGSMRKHFSQLSYYNACLHALKNETEEPNELPAYLPDAADEKLYKIIVQHPYALLRMKAAEAEFLGDFDTALHYFTQSSEALKLAIAKYPKDIAEDILVHEYVWIRQLAENRHRPEIAFSYSLKELDAQKQIFQKSRKEDERQKIFPIFQRILTKDYTPQESILPLTEDYFSLAESYFAETHAPAALDDAIDAAERLLALYRETEAPFFKRIKLARKLRRYQAQKKKAEKRSSPPETS